MTPAEPEVIENDSLTTLPDLPSVSKPSDVEFALDQPLQSGCSTEQDDRISLSGV